MEPSIDTKLAQAVIDELHKQGGGLSDNDYLILLSEVYDQVEGLIEAHMEFHPELSRECL